MLMRESTREAFVYAELMMSARVKEVHESERQPSEREALTSGLTSDEQVTER